VSRPQAAAPVLQIPTDQTRWQAMQKGLIPGGVYHVMMPDGGRQYCLWNGKQLVPCEFAFFSVHFSIAFVQSLENPGKPQKLIVKFPRSVNSWENIMKFGILPSSYRQCHTIDIIGRVGSFVVPLPYFVGELNPTQKIGHFCRRTLHLSSGIALFWVLESRGKLLATLIVICAWPLVA